MADDLGHPSSKSGRVPSDSQGEPQWDGIIIQSDEIHIPQEIGTSKDPPGPYSNGRVISPHRSEMAHEGADGPEGSPQQTPSPPHASRVPGAEASFHQQILQSASPRKSHIAERAKQSLENNFLLQLKKQQQLQQEILLQHFQQQRQQLAEQHEQQLRHHLKLWEQQKALEEAALREAREAREARESRERQERERLELLRKDKQPSANASTQVKQKLQEFLKKKQAAANANGTVPGSPYRNWGIVKSSSGESITSCGGVAATHPYRLPAAPPPLVAALQHSNSSDFPLRKTASEPNMLKLRLKSRLTERRASPLARRPLKARHKHRNCSDGSSPRGSPTSCTAPIREEEEPARAPDLLFSSPSLPNISLNPHPHHLHTQVPPVLPPVSEAEGLVPGVAGLAGVVAGAGACVARAGGREQRPLGRTHSAPLPLGDVTHYTRDQIRRTVLTRAHDAAAAQLREEEGEVIDLTSRRAPAPDALPPPPPAPPCAAPLARALSSPLVGIRAPPTALAYDPVMLKHGCSCGGFLPVHPEHSGRLQSIWARLCSTGLARAAERTRPRKCTLTELQSVHTEAHVSLYAGRGGAGAAGAGLARLACGGLGADADTAWAEGTPAAARTAAGAVLDLALRVAASANRNGFAVVRPPGHHAEPAQAMGFCFFNNVAIAANLLHTRMNLQRILIVDWDVHHGNGTQQIFYSSPHVLYISLHRHDEGNFFPGTGAVEECGAGAGLGYNVNVAWGGGLNPPLGDAEYLAAFRSVVMPIAREYDPQLVLVSCGFDAARGHAAPLGGYLVSPACFAYLTQQLMTLAGGKVVLSLEGGYSLASMCDCAAECVRALLGRTPAPLEPAELTRAPADTAQRTLRHVHHAHAQHWPTLKRYSHLIEMSAVEAEAAAAAAGAGRAQTERDAADTAAAMATLSVHATRRTSPDSSRSVSEEPMEQDEGK